jgi:DNA-binding MarR family transcriptional regulator
VTTMIERQTPAKAEDLELAGLLLDSLRLVKMATAASREHSHVSANRAGVMWQLRERAMRSGDLAQRCAMTAPALTELVDSLTREGFVRRLEDAGDRRVVLVELTAQGRRELDKHREGMKRGVAALLARIPAEKRARLRAALRDLNESIDAINKEIADAR